MVDDTVQITPDVITLVEELEVDYKTDKPQIVSKRPFGNSDYYKDVLELTGQLDEHTNDYGAISDEGKEVVEDLLHHTTLAMDILFKTQNLEVGTYEREQLSPTSETWVKVD